MDFPADLRMSAWPGRALKRWLCLFLIAVLLLPMAIGAALPRRLVILVDGIAYRDMKALQQGVTYTNAKGRELTCKAFQQGYFPVSRLVSTFPSASDVAWTDILGNCPLPGYQRTYVSSATGELIRQNGVMTSMEYERQMHWELTSGFLRSMGYVYPKLTFKHEVRELITAFLETTQGPDPFYAMIRASDDAQHTTGDILALLCFLDEELQQLSALYRASEGRDLEILILSDHGNNHAGSGRRVQVQSFLKRAGYQITDALHNPKDLVLPTVGIQNWVEVNCHPTETQRLTERLTELEGVDVLTAKVFADTNQFLVMNAKRERALIEWNPANDSFRYTAQSGDPLDYEPVIGALAGRGEIDADGFATAEAWCDATLTHRYPLALERIARSHSRLTLNPAPILIGLSNGYTHSSWMLKQFSTLMRMGGTHGGLDDLCSNGIVLSNFLRTEDTSSGRVAQFFDGFEGLKASHAGSRGAEWTYREVQAMTAVARSPLERSHAMLPEAEPLLRIWTPLFTDLETNAQVEVVVRRERRFSTPRVHRSDAVAQNDSEQRITLSHPLALHEPWSYERVYVLPDELVFDPLKVYRISGRARTSGRRTRIFDFTFHTDSTGRPLVQ